MRRSAMAFFYFYGADPRDMDLALYLFNGGMKAVGPGKEPDARLNDELWQALSPINQAFEDLGEDRESSRTLTAGVFAHASGLLLLEHTGRLHLFGVTGEMLMHNYLDSQLKLLEIQQ